MLWQLLPLIKSIEPDSVRVILGEQEVWLTPTENEWFLRLSPGYLVRMAGSIRDFGKKIGQYVRLFVWPLRAGARIARPIIDVKPAELADGGGFKPALNPGLLTYDVDIGAYWFDMDYSQSPMPVVETYDIGIRYPRREEVWTMTRGVDEEALANYGEKIRIHVGYMAYELDMDLVIRALRRIFLPVEILRTPMVGRIG